jgi:hypothetical protein
MPFSYFLPTRCGGRGFYRNRSEFLGGVGRRSSHSSGWACQRQWGRKRGGCWRRRRGRNRCGNRRGYRRFGSRHVRGNAGSGGAESVMAGVSRSRPIAARCAGTLRNAADRQGTGQDNGEECRFHTRESPRARANTFGDLPKCLSGSLFEPGTPPQRLRPKYKPTLPARY